ncbi:MAG TPA: Rv3654c family TadE-like protein [Actinospica sp.]|jgi:secretion/DNA translocation related TadE-like protein|nr:Rv3654c family TadE-like protein [Actinospica sp.]
MDDSERGSATIWMICILLLVSAAAGWALLWATAQSTRHSVERAADSAALAAATAALHRLAAQAGPAPCASAAQAAQRGGAELVACDCYPLDCQVTVKRSVALFGSLVADIPPLRRLGPLQAASRAGPVGEAGADDGAGASDGAGTDDGAADAVGSGDGVGGT